MFTNLILYLCQSNCLCRCQMYLFNAFYVTYVDSFKWYPSLFDTRVFSTGVSVTVTVYQLYVAYIVIWQFFSCFHSVKCRLLYFYIHISLTDPIFTFSLQPGSGGNHFRIFCATVFAVVRSTTFAIRHPTSGVSGCGVTRYREELRIFVKP